MERLSENECPFVRCVRWAAEEAGGERERWRELLGRRRMVLQENELSTVAWEAFSVPELERFVARLEGEEAERVEEICSKYASIRREYVRELRSRDSGRCVKPRRRTSITDKQPAQLT